MKSVANENVYRNLFNILNYRKKAAMITSLNFTGGEKVLLPNVTLITEGGKCNL